LRAGLVASVQPGYNAGDGVGAELLRHFVAANVTRLGEGHRRNEEMRLVFTHEELSALRDILSRMQELLSRLPATGKMPVTCLEFNVNEALFLQQMCSYILMLNGFDEHYNPTKEGRILESIIDKISAAK